MRSGETLPRVDSDANFAEALVTFAARVRLARKQLGLSQSAVADRAGLHLTYVGKIELGRATPTLS